MWQNLQETLDLVTFTEEILDGKLHFLCSVKTVKSPEFVETESDDLDNDSEEEEPVVKRIHKKKHQSH